MYTQCPHCQTIFGVSETHLSAAFGRVRCGHCRGQFNAKRHLLDELPEQQPQAEVPPVVEHQPLVIEPTKDNSEEIEVNLSDVIPADEIDHIDLSSPITTPEVEEQNETHDEIIEASPDIADDYIDLSSPTEEPELTDPAPVTREGSKQPIENPQETAELPLIESKPENEELDAIFAALDNRLEELSDNTDEAVIKPFEEFEANKAPSEDYQDAFGDPDSQTEDDIKASIETIFATAEAELAKTDTTDDSESDIAKEISLEMFVAEAEVELMSTNELELPEQQNAASEPSGEDIFTTETENTELAADDDELAFLDDDRDESVSEQASSQAEEPAFEQEELPFVLHEDLTTEPIAPRSWQKTLGLSSFIAFLLMAIGFQLALFRNVELANKLPELKPYLVSFCQYLPCQFSGQRDVKRIQLTSRDVRSHPDGKNTILISAIFVNNARFDQPYPDILITLSDLTTTVVAQRRFTPQNYLAKANTFQLLKSGKPVHITLEVLDPGNDAVNFQFEFL